VPIRLRLKRELPPAHSSLHAVELVNAGIFHGKSWAPVSKGSVPLPSSVSPKPAERVGRVAQAEVCSRWWQGQLPRAPLPPAPPAIWTFNKKSAVELELGL
jgi:hypothetical protein